jgi:uncharacterized protein (UPF0548 family)
MPHGYTVDHTRLRLGRGRHLFEAAKSAIDGWKQFALGWLEALPADTPIRKDATVGVLVRAAGLWWLNSARIVYVVDESNEEVSRYGFAYGTLPGHVEAGEERFLIEWHHGDDTVWYDILAFSRPRHLLTRIGRFQVRRMQKRFSRDSAAAMQRTVQSAS